ncbi:MAG: hypothetical protein ACYS4W_02010 [Planctomycetota bacterium]|jgi:hypothetical protein
MKKRDIWISLAIIAGAIAAFYLYSGGEGYIKVDTPGFDTTVNLRRGWWYEVVTRSGRAPVKVRAGAYKLTGAELRKKEGRKEWWTILCRSRGGGKLSKIRVGDGETTVLKVGPPLTVHPEVSRSGRTVSIGLSLIGRAGERWIPAVFASERDAPKATLKIVDEGGKVLASGKFEYG